jgi:hypothetical protein
MSETDRQSWFSPRTVFTLIVGLLFAVAVALIEVPTSLGVKVPRPDFGQPDLSGSERIWRVWWRARDDLIDVEPQWLVTGGLIALLVVFAAGMLLAIWLVTGPPTSDDTTPADG